MNRSGLFFLISAIIIALAATWFNTQFVKFKYFQISKKEKKIDYYLSDFTLLNVKENGQMRYLVTGKHLIHQQVSGASEIINPVLEASNIDGTITSLVSKKAIQEKKNGKIQLQGLVAVNKESAKELSNGYNIQTSDLIYNPITREIRSDSKLTFKSANGTLQGTGFSSKIDEQEFRIHSNVQAIYQPQKK